MPLAVNGLLPLELRALRQCQERKQAGLQTIKRKSPAICGELYSMGGSCEQRTSGPQLRNRYLEFSAEDDSLRSSLNTGKLFNACFACRRGRRFF